MNTVAKIDATDTAPAVHAHDPMVSMIERVVMDPNADLGKLEKMLDMKERIEAREARRAFDQAISSAKAEIGPIERTGTVDYENSKGDRTYFKHETLDGIARIVDPVLSKHGLSYRFESDQHDGAVHVTCVISHRDGHYITTKLQGAPDGSGGKNNYQAVGSAVTYLQRYTLKLALGLSAARDDDGKVAKTPQTITEEQYLEIRDLCEKAGVDEAVVCAAGRVQHLPDLSQANFEAACKKLRKTIEAKAAS